MAFAAVVRGVNRLEIKNESSESEILLLGSIGKSWWDDSGITESEFRNALNSIPKGKPVTLKINSEVGSVQEGLGIYNAICERSADITAKITGYALSIASVFPLGAGKVVSPKSSIWMIHCAWSWAQGNADDMRKQADMLDIHDETLAGIYQKHTGMSRADIENMMEAETWMNGDEAVANGLADESGEDAQDASASLRPLREEYISRCKNLSATILAAVKRDTSTPDNKTTPATIAASISPTTTPPGNNENQNQNKPMPEIITPAAAKPAADNGDVLAQVQAQLATERRARITAEVTRRSENKIANDSLNWWIDRAVADEAGTMAQIDKLPAAHVGADPLGAGQIQILDGSVPKGFPKGGPGSKPPTNMVVNIFNENASPTKRYKEMVANWTDIFNEAQRKDNVREGVVLGANTYSGTITTSMLIMGATTKLSPKFAAIKAFSRDVSVDPYKPLATGVMKFTSSLQNGTTGQTNATNFESSTSEIDPVSITVNQKTNSASITNSDLNSGFRMEDISHATLIGLGSLVMQAVTTPITTANFTQGAPGYVAALDPNAFGFSDTRKLYSLLKFANTRNLVLDTEYTAGLLNQPVFFQKSIEQEAGPGHWQNVFGWDNVFENTEWSAAGANVHGFACDPQAIGVLAGLPITNGAGIPGGILSVSTGTIPGADLPIAAYLWFNTSTRTYWMSYDMMIGANLLDLTAGVVIKSA